MSAFLYLASASPRRRELLAQLGVEYRVWPADIDEARRPGEPPADYVLRVALDKARTVAGRLGDEPAPVLAADTAVVLGGDVLGKPRDGEEACAMLSRLSGAEHEVLTGVAVCHRTREATALSHSVVRFRRIDRAQARAYWHTGEPRDKAGGYAIQGLGAIFVERLEGSYSGVVGLPLYETAGLLQRFGLQVLEPAA